MRFHVAGVLLLASTFLVAASPAGKAKTPPRFRVDADLEKYPQKTTQETLASVLKAIENKQIDYLLAHLTNPEFVDKKVDYYLNQLGGGKSDESKIALAFGRLVKATAEHFQDDPTRIKEFYRFAKDGDWQTGEKNAVVRHKSVPTRRVFFTKIQDRWFLEDRDK